MYIIDQHAAHERIMYEKVKANYYDEGERDEQFLLLPDVISLTHKEMIIAKENVEMFNRAGFSFEEFGENTIKITGVPNICIDLDTKEEKEALEKQLEEAETKLLQAEEQIKINETTIKNKTDEVEERLRLAEEQIKVHEETIKLKIQENSKLEQEQIALQYEQVQLQQEKAKQNNGK